jgi:hypothetical protein
MKPWYRNSTLQMDDPEMEWLQSQDTASCAVWEWLKSDCQKHETDQIRQLSDIDQTMVAKRLGIDSPRFSQVSQRFQKLGWISQDLRITKWSKWQASRTAEEDAMRKQVEYWKAKVTQLQGVTPNKVDDEKAQSPATSQNLPTYPIDERRGEENKEKTPIIPKGDVSADHDNEKREAKIAAKNLLKSQEQQIWDAYPKKAGKPKALSSIRKALGKRSFEDLLDLTKKYARAVQSMEPAFIPHPQKWFNHERYNDDPSTWIRSTEKKHAPHMGPRRAGYV